MITAPISILKGVWSRGGDGRWGIVAMKGIELKPKVGFDGDYFAIDSDVELLTNRPPQNLHDAFASFGTTEFLMKQSVVPVVIWRDGDDSIRCVGTASIISCSGYVMTAAHVLADPFENEYGGTRRESSLALDDELNFGVFVPYNPAYGSRGFRYFPFEKFWFWGGWKESPLFHEKDSLEFSTDIAIAKISEQPNKASHQPINLSLNPFVQGEDAYSLGYAEMADIPIEYNQSRLHIKQFEMNLYVSTGRVMNVFGANHIEKQVPTPGPCFEFNARIPGKMSGAPIFGARGAVVRGVVSRSFSGEKHAFGSMLGPAMHLPLDEPQVRGRTLQTLIASESEGIARVMGVGL